MAYKFNPFTDTLDLVGSGGGSYIDGEVEYHSNLPVTVGSPAVNSAFLVRKGEGFYFLTRKPAGIWVRELNNGNLDDWKYAGTFSDLYRDANFRILNNADVTKELAFDVSGVTTATTRTLTVPNASGTLALTEQAADIEITDATKGVILKSANNTRYRLTVTNSGLPVFTSLLLLLLAQLAPAQTIGMATDTNGTILTDRAASLTFTNALAWNDTTNAAITRTNLALGTTNNVQFRRLKMIAAGAEDNGDDATLWLDTSGTNKFASMRISGTGGSAEKYNAYLTAGPAGLNVNAVSGFRVLNGGTANSGSVLFSVGSSGNATMNGTGSVAPNQTASSGSSLMTRDLSDVRYGPFPSAQTVSVFDDIIYSVGATRGKVLRGTIAMPSNNTEYRLFNTTALANNSVGYFYVSIAGISAAAGFGNIMGFMQGNQGDSTALATRTVFNNSAYWVSFTTNTTFSTGDTITGGTTGATAKVWHTSVFTNTARSDVWLYDVTGIFTTADTNVSRNGTPTGSGIAGSVWGASPSTNTTFFIYRTRSTNSNSVTMPAIFNRYGTNLTALFNFEAL